MPAPTPRISAVVATRDRPTRLKALLRGLRAQALVRDAFEVIVVDDGSAPETGAVLAAELERDDLRLRVQRHAPSVGRAAARNTGWRLAAAPLVAFTDDDCVPAPRWLAAGLDAHVKSPRAIAQGRTEPDPADPDPDHPFSRTIRIEWLGPIYETCNIFYPRELLVALGGFDERFGLRWGGEDTDLAWRAIDSGREAMFVPEALVYHAVERLGPLGTLRAASRWKEAVGMFARHPETRTILKHGFFWNVWHYLLVRSVLALFLPRPLRRFLLMRHALELQRRARRAGVGAWAIPFLVVQDAVELWAVARGAVRYHTLVL